MPSNATNVPFVTMVKELRKLVMIAMILATPQLLVIVINGQFIAKDRVLALYESNFKASYL